MTASTKLHTTTEVTMSSPVLNATTLPISEWIGGPPTVVVKAKDIARKVKHNVKAKGKKQTGQRADGLPKKTQVVRKGGRQYGYTVSGKRLSASWIMDNHTPSPDNPESRYPETHPLWSVFVSWVKLSNVVRHDLLDSHPQAKSGNDWKQVWLIFLAGAITSAKMMINAD